LCAWILRSVKKTGLFREFLNPLARQRHLRRGPFKPNNFRAFEWRQFL